MAQQETARKVRARDASLGVTVAPVISVRLAGALLALAVAAVHIADQGSITTLASPYWIGWGYRLIEVGGLLTAAGCAAGPACVARLGGRDLARRGAVPRLRRVPLGRSTGRSR